MSNIKGKDKQPKTNLTDKVRRSIAQCILEGTFHPDQHLTEHELATQFGVSRTPLREALRQLEIQGYLTRRQSVGYVVAHFSSKHMYEVFELRKTLESMAMGLACEHATVQQIKRAEGYLRKYDEELSNPALRDLNDIFWGAGNWNNLFHEELYDACGNKLLVSYIANLRDMSRLKYTAQYFHHADLLQFQGHHYMLLNAIKDKDPDKAEESVRLHLSYLYNLYTNLSMD
jgi:DNA-binding GntR family transcriptional regulator